MAKVSIILPSRNEPYLKKTIEDFLAKAKGDIEIIAILDDWWDEDYVEDPRVSYIHFTGARGMRAGINAGVAVSRGEYIMKADAHIMVGEGYDEILKKYHEPKMIQVPRRYALDVQNWKIEERTDDKYPIDEMLLDENLQGRATKRRFTQPITDLQTSQGSCWFMEKEWFNYLELEDEETYGTFWQEFQEVGFKCWLAGGRVVTNIETYYAHFHKTGGRGYTLPEGEQEKTREIIHRWKTEKMFKHQIHPFSYMINKFK